MMDLSISETHSMSSIASSTPFDQAGGSISMASSHACVSGSSVSVFIRSSISAEV